MIITQWESTLLVGGHRIEQLSYYLEKPLFIGLHFVSSEISHCLKLQNLKRCDDSALIVYYCRVSECQSLL